MTFLVTTFSDKWVYGGCFKALNHTKTITRQHVLLIHSIQDPWSLTPSRSPLFSNSIKFLVKLHRLLLSLLSSQVFQILTFIVDFQLHSAFYIQFRPKYNCPRSWQIFFIFKITKLIYKIILCINDIGKSMSMFQKEPLEYDLDFFQLGLAQLLLNLKNT